MKVTVPSGMFGANSNDDLLCAVIRQISQKFAPEDASGWSDPSKYGCDFENDVFLIHHDCQCCFQEDPKDPEAWGWTDGAIGGCLWCRCANLEQLLLERFGTDDYSRFEARRYYDPPNFWWKRTDLRVTWYKYIGRDMATNRDFNQDEIIQIAGSLLGRTLEEVAAAHAKDSQERAAALAQMFKTIME